MAPLRQAPALPAILKLGVEVTGGVKHSSLTLCLFCTGVEAK